METNRHRRFLEVPDRYLEEIRKIITVVLAVNSKRKEDKNSICTPFQKGNVDKKMNAVYSF